MNKKNASTVDSNGKWLACFALPLQVSDSVSFGKSRGAVGNGKLIIRHHEVHVTHLNNASVELKMSHVAIGRSFKFTWFPANVQQCEIAGFVYNLIRRRLALWIGHGT